jgi:hypothetical protein
MKFVADVYLSKLEEPLQAQFRRFFNPCARKLLNDTNRFHGIYGGGGMGGNQDEVTDDPTSCELISLIVTDNNEMLNNRGLPSLHHYMNMQWKVKDVICDKSLDLFTIKQMMTNPVQQNALNKVEKLSDMYMKTLELSSKEFTQMGDIIINISSAFKRSKESSAIPGGDNKMQQKDVSKFHSPRLLGNRITDVDNWDLFMNIQGQNNPYEKRNKTPDQNLYMQDYKQTPLDEQQRTQTQNNFLSNHSNEIILLGAATTTVTGIYLAGKASGIRPIEEAGKMFLISGGGALGIVGTTYCIYKAITLFI